MPSSPPDVSMNAPPANPSCIGAVVRNTWSIARRRPVGSGPPITDTMPALAVTTLLHERATASARWPTRGLAAAGAIGFVPRSATRSTARLVVGSQPASSASSVRPSSRRTCRPSSRPSARTVVSTTLSAYTRPLAGRRRPWTWTTEGDAAATASASWLEKVVRRSVVMPPSWQKRATARITQTGSGERSAKAFALQRHACALQRCVGRRL